MTHHPVDELLVSHLEDGALVEVTFNRPHRHNAFTSVMYDGLRNLFTELKRDGTARVVVFRGAGAMAFAAGNEIGEFANMTEGAQGVAYEARVRDCSPTWRGCRRSASRRSTACAWAGAWPSLPTVTCGSPPPRRGSGIRSPAPWATRCPVRCWSGACTCSGSR